MIDELNANAIKTWNVRTGSKWHTLRGSDRLWRDDTKVMAVPGGVVVRTEIDRGEEDEHAYRPCTALAMVFVPGATLNDFRPFDDGDAGETSKS